MPVAAKTKRTAEDGGSAPKKAKTSRAAAKRDIENQYYQGVDTLDLQCGQGGFLLGSPDLTFHSPMDEPMWFEIMSGTGGQGTGCIHLCGHGKGPRDTLAPSFIVPFRHIEQFIIIDEPKVESSTASREQAYRVIIVPTASVGASPLKRTYPQIIQFNLPDKKAGKDFKGAIGEANDDPDETYRSIITRVINEQLEPYQKTVIDASSAHAAANDASAVMVSYDVGLEHEADKKAQKDAKIKGQLFFLKTGILFHSPTTVLYLTAKSTSSAMLIHNFEVLLPPEAVNLTLVCPTSEPYYDGAREADQGKTGSDDSAERVYISFTGIDRDISTSIAQLAGGYGIELMELDQRWYSLEKDQPSTGWEPHGSAALEIESFRARKTFRSKSRKTPKA